MREISVYVPPGYSTEYHLEMVSVRWLDADGYRFHIWARPIRRPDGGYAFEVPNPILYKNAPHGAPQGYKTRRMDAFNKANAKTVNAVLDYVKEFDLVTLAIAERIKEARSLEEIRRRKRTRQILAALYNTAARSLGNEDRDEFGRLVRKMTREDLEFLDVQIHNPNAPEALT